MGGAQRRPYHLLWHTQYGVHATRGLFALLVLCGVCLSVISYHAFWKMCIIRRENTLEYGFIETLTLCHDTKPSNKTTTHDRQHPRIARGP